MIKTDPAMTPLRIAAVPEHFNLPWRQRAALHDSEHQMFEKIDYREYAGGTGAMAKALADDDVDIAILLTEGAVLDIAKGARHKIVKVYVDTPLEWGIHVPANSQINDVAQIKGQRYAISRKGSGSYIMAAVHAAKQGWPAGQLRFVKVNNLDGARKVLPAGDAEVFFWEKTMTQPYVDAGEFRRVGVFHSPWPSFVVCVATHVIAQQSQRIYTLLSEINHLAAQLQNNSDSAKIIANTYHLTLEASETWLRQTKWNLDFSVPRDHLQSALTSLKSLDMNIDTKCEVDDLVHSFSSESITACK